MNTGGNLGGIISIPSVGYLSGQHLWVVALSDRRRFRPRQRAGLVAIDVAAPLAATSRPIEGSGGRRYSEM